ncbi:hypothetical protein ABLN64_06910 [Mycobacterium tuberculosis]
MRKLTRVWMKRRTKNAKAFHDKMRKLTRVWKSFCLNTQILRGN